MILYSYRYDKRNDSERVVGMDQRSSYIIICSYNRIELKSDLKY